MLYLRNAIGIDPDSKGIQCVLVKLEESRLVKKGFMATEEGMESFIRWIQKQGDVIVAIEGSNGQSRPVERALREAEIIFYSFKPSDVDKFRKAVLGQHKNNEKDAESTARYAMALEAQGKLENLKRVWFPDDELRGLTRTYEQRLKEKTSGINSLWKLLRIASVDLYLSLGGNNPDSGIKENILQNEGILTLLSQKPNIYEWKTFSDYDFFTMMGGQNYKGRMELSRELVKISKHFEPISKGLILMIRHSANTIIALKNQMSEIKRMLAVVTKDNAAVNELMKYKGIGIITASTIAAEIIDIRRFITNNNLASYGGLGRYEYKTGDNNKEISGFFFNRRLKNALITAAKNFVLYNPDSHLTGYHRNLVKDGMNKTESYKRVARALVRIIFRDLTSLIDNDDVTDQEDAIKHENETLEQEDDTNKSGSDMASGIGRSDNNHSNISLPPNSIIHLLGEKSRKKQEEKPEKKLIST